MQALIILFAFLLTSQFSYAQSEPEPSDDGMESEEKTELYHSLCHKPAEVFIEIDLNWVNDTNMKSGWIFELGNNISRLHLADILVGEHLPDDYDDFDNLCAVGKYQEFSINHVNGTSSGYGNQTAHWECHGAEEAGAFDCEFSSDLSKYIEKVKYYPTYSDNKNFFVMVTCYSEGQVGWFTHSINYPLSDESRKDIQNYIKQLGFDEELLQLYGPNCV